MDIIWTLNGRFIWKINNWPDIYMDFHIATLYGLYMDFIAKEFDKVYMDRYFI